MTSIAHWCTMIQFGLGTVIGKAGIWGIQWEPSLLFALVQRPYHCVACMCVAWPYTSVKVGRTHLASQTLLGITTETSLGINGALTLQWHLSGGRRLWDIALSRREGGGGKSKTVGLV